MPRATDQTVSPFGLSRRPLSWYEASGPNITGSGDSDGSGVLRRVTSGSYRQAAAAPAAPRPITATVRIIRRRDNLGR
ncbi:hypothetical protein Q0Z83_024020 [Actinoplanes sichuanensis]|nr:hypothetical protein Q0Z83_024020 [Actinoplanes sichuanensis]